MHETLERLIREFGVKILVLALILIIALIAFAHIVSSDGSKVSVLYGLVEYTKSVEPTKNSLKIKSAVEPSTTIKGNKKTTVSGVANEKTLPRKEKFTKLYINSVYAEGYEKFTLGVDIRDYLHDKNYSFKKSNRWIGLFETEHKYIRNLSIYFNEETLVSEEVLYWLHDEHVKKVLDLSINKLGYKHLTKNILETIYEWKNISGFNIKLDLSDNTLSIKKYSKQK